MRNIEQEDLDANAAVFQQQSATLLHGYALETNREIIPPNKYRELMRGLNTKQRQAVNFHRKWCKDAVITMKKGEPIRPYRVFLSGPGGVRKSYVISHTQGHCETIATLSTSRTRGCYDSTYWSCSF